MRLDLSLRQLEAFVKIAESKSFRQAAVVLGQSQPALSRLIQQAEQAIGARLFDRDTRQVVITATGLELLPIAERILRDFDDALGDLGEFMAGRRGHVSVATLPSAGVALLAPAIAGFSAAYPHVRFVLKELPAEDLLDYVEHGGADIGVGVRPAPMRRLHYRPVYEDPFVLLCRSDNPLAARAAVPWAVCGQQPCIVSAPHSSIRALTDAAFMRLRNPVRPVLEYPGLAIGGALVRAGLGITPVPRMALRLLDMDGLAAVPLQRPAIMRSIGVVTRIGRSLAPVTRVFMEHLCSTSYALSPCDPGGVSEEA